MIVKLLPLALLFVYSALAAEPVPAIQIAPAVQKVPPPPSIDMKTEGPKPLKAEPRAAIEIPAQQHVPLSDTAAEEDDGEDEEVHSEITEIASEELDGWNDFDLGDFDADRSGHPRRHHGGRGPHRGPHHRRRPHPRPGPGPHPRPGPGPHPRPGPHPTGRPHTGPTRRPHPHPRPTHRPHLGLVDGPFNFNSNSESFEQSSSSSEEKPKSMAFGENSQRIVGGAHKDIEREKIEEYAILKMHEFRRTCGLVAIILGWISIVAMLAICARLCCCYLRHRHMGVSFIGHKHRFGGAPYSVMVDAAPTDRAPIIGAEPATDAPLKESI